MYNIKIVFLHMGIIFCLLPICISCEEGPEIGLYGWDYSHHTGNVRYLLIFPDSILIEPIQSSTKTYYDFQENLWCLDSVSHVLEQESLSRPLFCILVHRPLGRTDTLYSASPYINFGHIHRECFMDKWIIIECRLPGRILGYSYLCDKAWRETPVDKLTLENYTYEGQTRIFKSNNFDYWVINRLTTDFYGPLTVKQLVKQLKELKIPFPVKLESSRSCYALERLNNGDFNNFPDSLYDNPKAFTRECPHGDKVRAKVIVEKKNRNSN